MVGPTFLPRDDVVYCEVAELEGVSTTRAVSLLSPKECVLVRSVGGKLAQVRPLRYVRAVDGWKTEQP